MKAIQYNIFMIMAAVVAPYAVSAQPLAVQRTTVANGEACGVTVTSASLERNGALMSVALNLGFADFALSGDRATVLTPMLINGTDSVSFDPMGFYGRIRYIQYLRQDEPLGGENETSFLYTKRPESMEYAQNVPYEAWMNGATLYIHRRDYGCCHTLLDEAYAPLAGWQELEYKPVFHYVTPAAETVKKRELSGRAYIDFPVNRTEIYPEYRKNPAELAKIIATIDSVRNDKDITVRKITIKGYASPESPYDNNTRLAKGRTATLKQYVRNLYHFDDDFIATDYEPEDWEGLRAFVAQSGLAHKEEILAIIDSDLEPDPKEWKIKSTYPAEYRFLLDTVYPGLRHSDYTIEYMIRDFLSVDELRETMAAAPQKLSLNEMFVLTNSLEPGSDEYNEVFETAVRMYPNDETANLNAANSAMQRNDLVSAGRYLAKAGDSAEAVYARGVLAMLQGDHGRAAGLFESVAGRIAEADEALKIIREVDNQNQ